MKTGSLIFQNILKSSTARKGMLLWKTDATGTLGLKLEYTIQRTNLRSKSTVSGAHPGSLL